MSEALPNPFTRLLNTPFRELLREGPTGSLHWRVALAAADLPAPINETIAAVVRRTRLWRSERFAVTQELVAHFRDGLESGTTAEGLVELFGDAKQAARLIRRAKRRCRPWRWQAWWWASRAVLALIAWYVGYGLLLLTGRAAPSVDYLSKLNAPVLATPEESRAWSIYERALVMLDDELGRPAEREVRRQEPWRLTPLARLGRRFFNESYEELSPEKRKELDDWLTSHQAFVDLLRWGASKPTLGFGIGRQRDMPPEAQRLLYGSVSNAHPRADSEDLWDRSVTSAMFPHQEHRAIGWVFERDLRSAVTTGESQRALDDAVALLDAADQAGEPAVTLGMHLDRAVRGMAIHAITDVLTKRPGFWGDAHLRDLAHRLSKPPRPATYYVRGERLSFLDMLQRVYTDNGQGDGRITIEGIHSFGEDFGVERTQVFAVSAFAKDAYGGVHQRLGGAMLAGVEMPRIVARLRSRADELAAGEAHFRRVLENVSQPLWARPDYRGVDARNTPGVLAMMASSGRWITQVSERMRGEIDGVLVGVALELYRREEGEWPRSLNELSPRWLPEAPIDRINGGPLGYTLVDDEPIVYSLGIDTDDDGGRSPGYMNDAENERLGYSTVPDYCVGPPLTAEELVQPRPKHYIGHDGDWVIWSLVEPRYMPRDTEQQETVE